jgi:DNA-binding transcriptional regulator YiaG
MNAIDLESMLRFNPIKDELGAEELENMRLMLPQIRKAFGWTVEQFAGYLGQGRSDVSRLEKGERKMTRIKYIAICSIVRQAAEDAGIVW